MQSTPPLIAAAQAGDPNAQAELYRQHHATVRQYIARRVTNRETADDLTQETFLRALRNLDRYVWTGRPIEAWLTTIARNLIADEFRRASHRGEVLTDDPAAWEQPTVAGPETAVLADLDAQPVRAALAGLRPDWREALVLSHWCGYTDRQIAARTGRSGGAVRALKHRAGRALRDRLTAAA